MKTSILLAMLFCVTHARAKILESTRIDTSAEVARIVQLVTVYLKPDIQINLVVKDLGGSTDLSPTQELYFTLYRKGEMFSTDATFKLGSIYDFKSAKKISNGVFEVLIGGVDFETTGPKNKLLIIDAEKAIEDILKIRCSDFDCTASKKFKARINIIEK